MDLPLVTCLFTIMCIHYTGVRKVQNEQYSVVDNKYFKFLPLFHWSISIIFFETLFIFTKILKFYIYMFKTKNNLLYFFYHNSFFVVFYFGITTAIFNLYLFQ